MKISKVSNIKDYKNVRKYQSIIKILKCELLKIQNTNNIDIDLSVKYQILSFESKKLIKN